MAYSLLRVGTMWQGTVLSIHIAHTAAGPMIPLNEVRAVPEKGLEGDRYFSKQGTYSNSPRLGRHVTLIEIEAIESLKRDYGIDLGSGESRRNIITRGVPLNHLVGKEFRIGEVTLCGIRLCEPCSHLEKLSQKALQRGLIHRGGLRTHVVSPGIIRVGDAVQS